MAFAHSGPAWVLINGPFVLGDGDAAISYPANWADLATDEERSALGIKEVSTPSTTPPEGEVFQGFADSPVDIGGVPTWAAIFATPAVPVVVTMRQAQLALNAAGHLSAVNTAIAGADAVTQINWNTATQLRRDNPLVATLGTAISLSSDDIDALFRAAALIPDP